MREEITKLPELEAKAVLRLPNSYFEKGFEHGKEQGELIKGKEIAKKMLEKGMDIESIIEFTELSREIIIEIKKEMEE